MPTTPRALASLADFDRGRRLAREAWRHVHVPPELAHRWLDLGESFEHLDELADHVTRVLPQPRSLPKDEHWLQPAVRVERGLAVAMRAALEVHAAELDAALAASWDALAQLFVTTCARFEALRHEAGL